MISLLTGNSRALLTIDGQGNWQELYYPYPGLHQLLRRARLGVLDRDNDVLRWLDEPQESPVQMGYLQDSNVCRTRVESGGLGLTIDDMVHPDRDMILRRIRIRNPSDEDRHLRVYHYQSLELEGSAYRETAFWDPRRQALHHYKRSYHAMFLPKPTFSSFSCGEHTLKGLEGSYVDAEDGDLMGNIVSHGAADSIGQWDVEVAAGHEEDLHLYVLLGRSRRDVHGLVASIDGRDPDMYIAETTGYWNRWVQGTEQPSFELSQRALAVYRRSLFVLRNCTAANGSVIASPDSMILRDGGDGYEYCWWRDGAYIAMAMAEAGMPQTARAFLRFAASCQEEDGSFLHRHFPDGKLGPTWHPPERIQVDQTASVLQAVHQIYRSTGDIEELLSNWELVRKGADFLMRFVGEDGLPLPSYDLWEERYATDAYAVGTVVKGLESAATISKALGRRYDFWDRTAQSIRRAALDTLWDDEKGSFVKSVNPHDTRTDASCLLVDLFPPGDARYKQVADRVEADLWQDGVGGIARYQGDQYFGKENPWVICTLWLARARLRLGEQERCRQLIEWAADRAVGCDLLPEQVDAQSGERRGVVPLVWSHSTFVQTVQAFSRRPAAPFARQLQEARPV